MPYQRRNGNYAISGTDREGKRYDIAIGNEESCKTIARLLQDDWQFKEDTK